MLMDAIQEEFQAHNLNVRMTTRAIMISRLSEDQLRFIDDQRNVIENGQKDSNTILAIKFLQGKFSEMEKRRDWPTTQDLGEKFVIQQKFLNETVIPQMRSSIEDDASLSPDVRELARFILEDFIICVTRGLTSRYHDCQNLSQQQSKPLSEFMRKDDMPEAFITRGRSVQGSFREYLGNPAHNIKLISNAGIPFEAVTRLVNSQFAETDPAMKYFTQAFQTKISEA